MAYPHRQQPYEQPADQGVPSMVTASHCVVFCAIGEPYYSDVPSVVASVGTYEAAEALGLRMLAVGNWKSFTIEKRYRLGSEGGHPDGNE